MTISARRFAAQVYEISRLSFCPKVHFVGAYILPLVVRQASRAQPPILSNIVVLKNKTPHHGFSCKKGKNRVNPLWTKLFFSSFFGT